MDWTWYLFRFDGRINRARLWLALLVILGWMMILVALTVAVGSLFGDPGPSSFSTTDIFKLMDPDTYRSLTTADLPPLAHQAGRHARGSVDILRHLDQAAA